MDFVALPKIEAGSPARWKLHAHLTGSIPRRALHDVWLRKRAAGEALALEDPLVALPEDKAYDIETIFPLFSSYIYALLTDEASVRETVAAVLAAFQADGVVYLELRTTPRASEALSAEAYVAALLAEIDAFEGRPARPQTRPSTGPQTQPSARPQGPPPRMRTRLILSVDRRHSLDAARGVLDIARAFGAPHSPHRGRIVGLDLCGDPHARTGGAVSLFTPVFADAKALGLGLTVHFAECEAATRGELETLLAWGPGRLGHVIHEDEDVKREIARRGLCLELCLSCNVQAGMVRGGFEGHHFGAWRARGVSISLGTDDVGVFGSELSNEYRLVAKHFGLDGPATCALAREAIEHIFGDEADKQWLREIMWTSM